VALTNKDRVQRGLEHLREGLGPFVGRMMQQRKGRAWVHEFNEGDRLHRNRDGTLHLDNAALLKAMNRYWGEVFSMVLGRAERTLVNELIEVRNAFAHDCPLSNDDTERALDSMRRLLEAVSAKAQAEAIDKSRYDLRRTIFAEETRQKTRSRSLVLEGTPRAGLTPWREIITPHKDVASGRYQQAEFAADLAQVHRGEGSDEYRDPVEFFSRTFITDGLRHLLEGAMLRLTSNGGDPVVELQTNFGGGKTHSMLALYHLFAGGDASRLVGVEGLMQASGVASVPKANRAVLVGTALSPGQPSTKPDGTVVNTLWGEMAWQLGDAEGYALIAESDQAGTSPGSEVLAELLTLFSPCLVLIDEWVAYVRQLYHVSGLPAGSFDANITFAQVLTEAVKAADRSLVVASLPASQIEIGGEGGQQALDKLKNTFGRVESSWRPATPDEGFEIVRRRLFEPITDKDLFASRDAVIRAFGEMYRSHSAEFPNGCGEAEYRRRMEAAYPIHPELFERLHNDWGSLDKFQRTRGVLRLMAAVIHGLWKREDRSLMILPASIPIDNSGVQFELVRYLESAWDSVIAHDIDGPSSVPLAIDQEIPNLGRYSATRRVARTIYMGSAPTHQGNNPGIDDRRIRLGCAQPGETVATFGDALRRLADRARFLYIDGPRYWFSTQPSVARLADDRAADYQRDDVLVKIVETLRKDRHRGEFCAVHVAPDGSADVPDEMEARLVVLGPDYPRAAKAEDSRAIPAAEEILTNRGSSQRLYKNMLAFLAPDRQRLVDLVQAVRLLMAWTSIVDEHEKLNLDAFQRRQAETKKTELQGTVEARMRETWVWALVPGQPDPQDRKLEWSQTRLQGQDPLAVRASKKLVQDESLITRMGPARLKLVLDRYLWPSADHIGTKQLWDYLASYLYLPRLRDVNVLADAVQAGISELVCDNFAYAGRYNEETRRYEGLKMTGGGSVVIDALSVLVRPAVAKAQSDAGSPGGGPPGSPPGPGPKTGPEGGPAPAPVAPEAKQPRRFFATVELSPDRAARDMGRVAEEVLQHLTILPNAKVRISVEIEAEVPGGVSDSTQRVVTENCQALKFKTHGFEAS
jgi:predicted AAA+ superfamily ATPase